MKEKQAHQMYNSSLPAKLWLAFGALIVVSGLAMILRETPAMRRELKLLRM